MIYRSNLSAPDLYPAFAPRVICKPRHNSLGHDVLSDSEDPMEVGFLTHDEAAILYECVRRMPGRWADVGSRFGWSTAHIAAALGPSSHYSVFPIDPIYADRKNIERFIANVGYAAGSIFIDGTSSKFFSDGYGRWAFDGVHIDGNHDFPEPLNDAKNAASHLNERGVIVFHDALGGSIQEAVVWLLDNGFRTRIYWTPHVMAVCWRGNFTPPDHVADPQIEPKFRAQMVGFPFERCE